MLARAPGRALSRARLRRGGADPARVRARRCSRRPRPRTLRPSRSWSSPGAAVACDERVGLLGPPRAGSVSRKLLPSRVPPGEDRVDESPLLLDLVAAREQGRVAAQCIEDQRLGPAGRVADEGFPI